MRRLTLLVLAAILAIGVIAPAAALAAKPEKPPPMTWMTLVCTWQWTDTTYTTVAGTIDVTWDEYSADPGTITYRWNTTAGAQTTTTYSYVLSGRERAARHVVLTATWSDLGQPTMAWAWAYGRKDGASYGYSNSGCTRVP